MKNIKKLFLVAVLLLVATSTIQAVPAYPGAITHKQSDGSTLTYYLRGDENYHAQYSTDGYMLRDNGKGAFCYVTKADDGTLVTTTQIAHNVAERSADEKSFLQHVTKIEYASQYKEAVLKVQRAPERVVSKSFPTKGNMRGLVFLVEFPDKSFDKEHTKEMFTRMMNDSNYTDYGATGSASKYFSDQSMGQFVPTFDVIGPIKMSRPESFYGTNHSENWRDYYLPTIYLECCSYAHDSLGVDFSKYDCNNDNLIDFVFAIYAGYGENYGADSTTIWPCSQHLEELGSMWNGKLLSKCACTCEMRGNTGNDLDGIGVFCHEFSHVLGLPDMYDTSGGNAALGFWDIMSNGNYNNNSKTPAAYSAFERYSLGWLSYTDLNVPKKNMKLPELTQNNTAYRLTTSNENEYFLLENRQQKGWDAYQGGKGLMITHVNYDKAIWSANTVNVGSTPHVDIEEADGTGDYWSESGDLFPGTSNVTNFTDHTTPGSLTWNGDTINKSVTNIVSANDTIYFNFKKDKLVTPIVSDVTEITDSSFVVNWNTVANALGYRVKVKENVPDRERTVALTEDFSLMSKGTYAHSTTADISSTLDSCMNKPGWTGEYVYQAGGLVKIGRLNNSGTLVSPALDLLFHKGTFTVAMKVRSYGTHVMKYMVKSYDGTTNNSKLQTDTLTTDSIEHTVVLKFTNGTSATHLSFTAMGERLYIDDLRVLRGDVDSTKVWDEDLDFASVVNGITDTHCQIKGLSSGEEYDYAVQALSDVEQACSDVSEYKTVKLTGELVGKLETPEVLDATEITDSSFVANWNAVKDALGYRVEVKKNIADNEHAIALSEDFSLMSEGSYAMSTNEDISTTLDKYMSMPGWTGSSIYQAGGLIKIGSRSSTSNGSLVSPALDLSAYQGAFTVAMKVRSYGVRVMNYVVKSYGEATNDIVSQSDTLTTDSVEHTVVLKFTNGTGATHLSITALGERLYVDDLRILRGDVDSSMVWSDALKEFDLVVNNITDTHCSINGLTAGEEYYYTVQALTESERKNSALSARKIVKLTKRVKLTAPEVLDATEITDSSFVANWNAVKDALAYRVEVKNNFANNDYAIALSEDFSLMSAGSYAMSTSEDISSSLDKYMNKAGWTGSSIYQAGGLIKIGSRSSTSNGSLVSPALDLSAYQGTFTVAMKVRSYGVRVMNYVVKSYGETAGDAMSQSDTLTTDSVEHTVVLKFTNGTSASHLSITALGERLYIDDLAILCGDVDSSTVWKAVKGIDLVVDSITDTHYMIKGLSAGEEYYYTVQALSDRETLNSDVSEHKIVKLAKKERLVAPEVLDATEITDSTFVSNWNAVKGARGYRVEVKKNLIDNEYEQVLSEDFSLMNGGSYAMSTSEDISSSLDKYMNRAGWTGSSIYQAGGLIKIGGRSGTPNGSLVSPALDLSEYQGAFTVAMKVRSYGIHVMNYVVKSYDKTMGDDMSQSDTLTTDSVEHTVLLKFTNGTSATHLSITALGERLYIDDLSILYGDGDSSKVWSAAKGIDLVVDNITDTRCLIKGLSAGEEYYYTVQALSDTKQLNSDVSERKVVKLTGVRSSVETLTKVGQPASVRYYSINGVCLTERPSRGYYIKVETYDDGTVRSQVVKR